MARLVTLRRFLLWLLLLVVVLVVAGGWYARVAWEEWRQLNSIQNLEWQGVDVSLAGVKLQRFSVSQIRDGQAYRLKGEELSLGWSWHWHGPMPDVVQVGQLTMEIPAWPGAEGKDGAAGAVPGDLPLWLPDKVTVDRLVLSLPDGLHAEGDLAVSQLSVPEERELVTNTMTVEAPMAERTLAGWKLHNGRASLTFSGKASEQSATLAFKKKSHLEFSRVDAPDNAAQLDRLRVNLANTKLIAGYTVQPIALETLSFKGPAVATAAAIHHPQLLPQPWRLEGRLEGSLETFRLDGRLSSNAGAGADIAFSFPFAGVPVLDLDMNVSGTEGITAVAETFTAWPQELKVNGGNIKTTLGLSFPSESAQVQGKVDLDDLDGLFLRTAWAGLNGQVELALTGDRLDVRTSGLALDTVNPGIPFTNIRVVGRYQAPLQRLAGGSLTLERASSGFLGGNVRIEPGEWQLSEMPLRASLELSGIELAELMQEYPADGLAGTGTLRGTVPVQIGTEGVSITSGRVEAVAPGGTLKLPADRLKAMARDNEAMSLVVQAMQNFNYSVLNSTVNYDQDGTLVLGLRLEGSSPDVRDGHPIVLNINLEEDIPALLTSLQLSGRVNEAVTEKVRNLMKKRDAESQ